MIASTQIKDFLGIRRRENPSEFFARIRALAAHFQTIDGMALSLGLESLALILLIPKIWPRGPGSIIALVAGTTIVAVFRLPVETIPPIS